MTDEVAITPQIGRLYPCAEFPPVIWIEPIDPLLVLEPMAARIRASSNFRFAWQWFSCALPKRSGPRELGEILTAVIDRQECHAFLNDASTLEPFTIERLHEHAQFVAADGAFEQTLARAAADQLGAYSRILRDATPEQVAEIRALFEELGPYHAFELVPGEVPGCAACKGHNNHLFSSWFYGVAWDWLFCVRWTEQPFVWLGCLSDTD